MKSGKYVLLSLILFVPCLAAQDFPKPGEWSCAMRDKGETGFSPAKGKITAPQYRVLFEATTPTKYLVIAGDSSVSSRPESISIKPLSAGTRHFSDFDLAPRLPAGQCIMSAPTDVKGISFAFGDFLDDLPGLECITLESDLTSRKDEQGEREKMLVRGYKFCGGKSMQIWEFGPVTNLYMGYPLIDDFDGDGKIELAMIPWFNLFLIDAASGTLKDKCTFSTGRNYGYFGAFDLDANGKKEFVIISDFYKHIDVIGFDPNGKLKILWQRSIELTLESPRRQMQVNPFGVADINGDGKLEIVVTLLNPPESAGLADSNDSRWHVVVYDGVKGSVLADFRDEYCAGVVDLDNDSISEILTQSTDSISIPEFGTARVHSLKGVKDRICWQKKKAAWQIFSPQLLIDIDANIQKTTSCLSGKDGVLLDAWTKRANGWARWHKSMDFQVNSGATHPDDNLLFRNFIDGAITVLKEPASAPGETTLEIVQWRNGGFETTSRLSGKNTQAIAIAPDKAVLVRVDDDAATAGAGVDLLEAAKRYPIVEPVAIGITEAGRAVAVKQTVPDRDEIVAFEIPRQKNKTASILWRANGRNQTGSWPETLGATITDLDLNGKRQLIYAARDEKSGAAKLVAADLVTGRIIWQHVFTHIPGTPPVWNTGGITFWKTGNFTRKDRLDVLVSVRRNIMHSDETYLLSGRNGSMIWGKRTESLHGRGCGGAVFAVADFNNDSLDEAASLYPDILYILDGKTGNDVVLTPVDQIRNYSGPYNYAYWGVPVAARFMGSEAYQIFFYTGRDSLTGLIQPDTANHAAAFVWLDAIGQTQIIHPAVGDFDGDGRLEVVCFKYKDGVHCYDAASGEIKWKNTEMPKPAFVTTADIDGDGKCECIATAGNTIWCIGNNAIKWTLQMPCWVGPPTLADISGSGLLSIILAGADGKIYAVE
ncbi:MAG: VCBS repeat-containing protein [Planctomycetota bacterium]|nr:VCBS repeat-containing protein [Planctomycetota bacterium]